MEKQYISDKQVAARYHIGRSTVWLWVKRGILPGPLKFGQRCSRWDTDDLDKHDKKAKKSD